MPVMEAEKEKSTVKVDEDEILRMSEKIRQNIKEDEAFSKRLDEYISSSEKTSEPLIVGRTPNSLSVSGANADLSVVIAPSTISKCMSEADEEYHGHGLSAEIMKQLPSELRNPAMIFKGNKDNSLVAITELKDKENREIMIAVALSDKKGFKEVNRISSAYGRNNMTNFLQNQMSQGHLIAANKEKADELLQSLGLQSPPEETFIGFDNSIAYSDKNVNTVLPENNKEKANKMLHSAGLQLPLENTFISFNNSIAYSDKNVNTVLPENSKENSESLLPILNAKYRNHISQIDNFNEKKAVCADKIDYRQGKIDKLTLKADRLEQTNKMLKSMFSNSKLFAPVNFLVQRNETKIKQIREERIPKHSKKIDLQTTKIEKLNHKIDVKQCKADKLQNLSSLIKSFGVLNSDVRHKQFTTALDGLHNASKRAIQFKIDKCDVKLNTLNEKYVNTNSAVEKLDMNKQIVDLNSRRSSLSDKLSKLQEIAQPFTQQPENTVDKLMLQTEKDVNQSINSGKLDITNVAENICVNNAEYLKNAEMEMEDDYDNIDGIINNGSKAQIADEQQAEIQRNAAHEQEDKTIQMSCIEVSHWLNRSAVTPDDTAKKVFATNTWLAEMGEPTQEFVNSDIEDDNILDKLRKHIDLDKTIYKNIMPETLKAMLYIVAVEKNTYGHVLPKTVELFNKNGFDIVNNQLVMKDARLQNLDKQQNGIQRNAQKQADELISNHEERANSNDIITTLMQDGKAEIGNDGNFKINADFYKSLSKENRNIELFDSATATMIMSELAQQNIDFSAVSRKNDIVAITTDKNDVSDMKNILHDSANRSGQQISVNDVTGQVETKPRSEQDVSKMSELQQLQYTVDTDIALHGRVQPETINTKENESVKSNNIKFPSYYKSLKQSDRHFSTYPSDVGQKIMAELDKSNTKYSAVMRENNTTQLTISRDDINPLQRAESVVKNQQAMKYIDVSKAKDSQRIPFSIDKLVKSKPKEKQNEQVSNKSKNHSEEL